MSGKLILSVVFLLLLIAFFFGVLTLILYGSLLAMVIAIVAIFIDVFVLDELMRDKEVKVREVGHI